MKTLRIFDFSDYNIQSIMKLSFILLGIIFLPFRGYCQEEGNPFEYDTLTAVKQNYTGEKSYENNIAGEFTPAKGFDLVKTEYGSLNLSGYILARWVNQLPLDLTYTDHLGNVRDVKDRNDLNIHRVFMWMTGFLGTEKFTYNITVWGLVATQQVLLFGNLQYRIAPQLKFGVGVGPNLGIRSLQGSWPFFNASDRQLGDESLRPGFTGSAWATGEALPRFYYTAAIGTNLSVLGVKASELTRDFSTSASLWWMPTTGEFGPRGGNGDFENHLKPATRFGVSFTHARDARFSPLKDSTTINTQVRLSDGVYLYEKSALAPGVTVSNADFNMGSVDVGFKYRGFFMQMQYYFRKLSNFNASGPLPLESIFDQMVQIDISHMIVPKTLCLYASGTYMFDEFKRNPNEISLGLNYYPLHSRSLRLNGFVTYVNKSSAGGLFGYYSQGMTGPLISLGVDVLL